MPQQFHFELVSPEEKLLSEDVTMVTIPGEEGDFGVLAGHAPLVSAIRLGVVSVYKASLQDVPQRIFIAGGFADVGQTGCTVLAEEAVDMAGLTREAVVAERDALAQKRAAANDDFERQRLDRRLAISEAKLAAL